MSGKNYGRLDTDLLMKQWMAKILYIMLLFLSCAHAPVITYIGKLLSIKPSKENQSIIRTNYREVLVTPPPISKASDSVFVYSSDTADYIKFSSFKNYYRVVRYVK
jgi:hypothetical protein